MKIDFFNNMELGKHIGFYHICKKYLASIFELNVCLNFARARPEAVVATSEALVRSPIQHRIKYF